MEDKFPKLFLLYPGHIFAAALINTDPKKFKSCETHFAVSIHSFVFIFKLELYYKLMQ